MIIAIEFSSLSSQNFTNLHNFTGVNDGANPIGDLVLSGSKLYGTAYQGGTSGKGTIFAVNTDGTGFTNLHNFAITITNFDGANPYAGLTLSGNNLYGTAMNGFTYGTNYSNGTVFAINTNGTGFRILHNFPAISGATNTDGATPYGKLILSGNTLYGTAYQGGWYSGAPSGAGNGTVFAVNTDGTSFTNLHNFMRGSYNSSGKFINSDGIYPCAGLILSGNTLYGTAYQGGSYGYGTVFSVNTDGTSFRTLHSFTATSSSSPFTNSDGANPIAGLILSGNTLYGTANQGGTLGCGTIFAVTTNGTGFTNLNNFNGIQPYAGLILTGITLFGTSYAYKNAGSDFGTAFAINIDGTETTSSLWGFGPPLFNSHTGSLNYTNNYGFNPHGLILAGNTLYGTAQIGGTSDSGTLFSISFSLPQLTITPSAANVLLSWPTFVPGVTLQSTTNLISIAVWKTNLTTPVIINGQKVVTNAVYGKQQFFRLSQ